MRIRLVLVTAVAVLVPAVPALADPVNTATVTTALVTSVRTTPGRVWWVESGNVLYVATVDESTNPATVSVAGQTRAVGTALVGTTTTAIYSPSADHLAFLGSTDTSVHVIDVTSGAAITSVPEATGLVSLKLSGSRLEQDTPTAVYVRDLTSGQQWTFPPSATLSGQFVAYFRADGSIVRQDLVAGTTILVRPAGQPSNCAKTVPCTPANTPVVVKMRGEWVFWKYSCELRGKNLATGSTTVDLSSASPCLRKFNLLDGWLLYKDGGGVLQAQNLTPGTGGTTPAPIAITSAAVTGYAAEDRTVSWYDANGVHVGSLQMPGYDPAIRLSGEVVPAAFSPNGDGVLDVWRPAFNVTADVPLQLVISNASGPVVMLTGNSAFGAFAPTWNAFAAVDGSYSWTLSRPGGLLGLDGKTAGLTGNVVVRRTGMAAIVAAPLVTTTASSAMSLTLSATGNAGLPGYGVRSYKIQVNDGGTIRTFTSSTSLFAVAGLQGHTYAVRAAVNDNAGITGGWSAVVKTVVPIDDRSRLLIYGGTWANAAGSAYYLGTVRSSRTAGSYVWLRVPLNRFAIVGTACAACGRIRVYLDGRYLATVDTYSARTVVRRILLLRSVSATVGTHTVKLVVLATPGRPTFLLDAVAAIR